MTQILNADSAEALTLAANLLQQGEVIALPTDTVYGVAALAFDANAVAKIYTIKNRPLDKAIPVFIESVSDLPQVCQNIPATAYPLLQQYWPGNLTVILPVVNTLPPIVTNHGPSIAVRIPNQMAVLRLLSLLKQPLAVTSANLSNQATPSTAMGVKTHLQDKIPLVLDGGPSPDALPSTILDLTQSPPKILRQGSLKISSTPLLNHEGGGI